MPQFKKILKTTVEHLANNDGTIIFPCWNLLLKTCSSRVPGNVNFKVYKSSGHQLNQVIKINAIHNRIK